MPMPLHGVHEVGQRCLEQFTADPVRGLPNHDDRFAYSLVVDAPSLRLLAVIVGSAAQQPETVLTVVAGYYSEFVQYPAFVPLGCLLVPIPDRCHKFLLRHLADASAHVAASRILGSILLETPTFVEYRFRPGNTLIVVDRKVIQEFGNGLDSGYDQVIPGTGAGDVEQVPLSVVDLLQVGLVDD